MIDLLRDRRSIRMFEKSPVDDRAIAVLKESLLRSPTSRGRNPWHFILIRDHALLEDIAHAKTHGSAFLSGTPLAFVICGDESISDVWIEDCSIAAITLQYTAHSLGLGSCWVQIRNRQHDEQTSSESYLQQLLGIPRHIRVVSIVGIGHPGEKKSGHAEKDLPAGKFHIDHF